MKISAPKGTQDLLPEVTSAWQYIEDTFRYICHLYGYEEIRIPTFEYTEVFSRGVGDTTDVVQKEMYTFDDRGGRSLTLRPEATAGVVRSFIEHGMSSKPYPVRLFYDITAFRYENVQKGRYREFHQLGLESFGSKGPLSDAEVIALASHFFRELGLKHINLYINSLGTPTSRKVYHDVLIAYFRQHEDELCEDSRARMETNPLRVLDCKEESCRRVSQNAPSILDYLDAESKEHFEGLQAALDRLGIAYTVDPRMVRGLDYYTKTVFEFVSANVGTQGTICGGGRYDNLVEELGGPSTPGLGFALGMERLIMELTAQGILKNTRPEAEIFIASLDDSSLELAQKLAQDLRYSGIRAQYELTGRSLRAQMKYADKNACHYIMVIGADELSKREAEVRSLLAKDSEPHKFSLDDLDNLVDFLRAAE